MPEVPAVADIYTVHRDAINDIGASLLPLDLVVEGRDTQYLHLSFPEAARSVHTSKIATYRACVVMIEMVVADRDDLGLDAGEPYSPCPCRTGP